METVIPCSDDFRHPDGTVVTLRLLPHLFFGADGGPTYPTSSPLRCHACLMHFEGPPLFIASSIQHHPPEIGGTTIEVTGHYCSGGCRNRALEELDSAQAETYRMNTVRADMEAFGRALDYVSAGPPPHRLDLFGGEEPSTGERSEFQRVRRATALPADLARGTPASIRWSYRLRGVRETWFGALEGGEGRERILEALASNTSPRYEPPARLRDPKLLEAFLSNQPGSPCLAVDGGRRLEVWPRAKGELCLWCAGRVDPEMPFLVPHHRDLLNTVHLEGNFCSPGCGLCWLTSARRGLSPTRHHERVGLFIWLCATVLGVPMRARPRLAPHRLEMDEFGGDLPRAEFAAQERREDLFTSLEEPPAVSRRMLGNYTRPGVVCDLTRLGSASGPVVMHGASASSVAQSGEVPGMFEELIRGCPPPQPPQPPPRRKGAVLAAGPAGGSE